MWMWLSPLSQQAVGLNWYSIELGEIQLYSEGKLPWEIKKKKSEISYQDSGSGLH